MANRVAWFLVSVFTLLVPRTGAAAPIEQGYLLLDTHVLPRVMEAIWAR